MWAAGFDDAGGDAPLDAAALLLVEDDPRVGAALKNFFRRYAPVAWVSSVAEAAAVATTLAPFAGAVIDVWLPDGRGLDLVPLLRATRGEFPILILTGDDDRELVNAAQEHGVEFALKPPRTANLAAFALRATNRSEVRRAALLASLDWLAKTRRLTPAERRIVLLSLGRVPRSELSTRMAVSENTVKTQVKKILQKCGATNLEGVVNDVLRDWRE